MKFTDKAIQALKSQGKRYKVCDSSNKGLRPLRDTPSLKKKTLRKNKEILERDILPRWQHRKASDISRADVIALLT